MSKIFKPRRGTTYTMRSTAKKSTVLAKGEMFLEVPNTGVGTGKSKIIIGDGITTYENLPIALSGTTTSDVIADTSTTVTAALNNVVSGKEMSNLFGSLKKAISLNQTSISGLNDKVPFSFAISNSVYGYKKADNTFVPFKSQADIDSAVAAAKVGTATAAQVLTGYTFTNSTTSGVSGTMANQGTKTYTINPGGSQTIPAGYHNGSGKVTANPNQNSGTYTPTTRAASIDMGANNTYRYVTTTSVPNSNTGTYNATTRSNSTGIDLGATNTYRYVRTDNVPNTNSAEYVFAANDTGAKKDMGATNTYRYVTATNVYNKGKADGVTTHTGTYTPTTRAASIDMGANHSYRYVTTTSVPNSNTGTYTPTSNGSALDMGETNTYRYINTNTVYNLGYNAGVTTHSTTKTISSSDSGWPNGTIDLGTTHTYRYVNMVNVYNKGVADGQSSVTANAEVLILTYGASCSAYSPANSEQESNKSANFGPHTFYMTETPTNRSARLVSIQLDNFAGGEGNSWGGSSYTCTTGTGRSLSSGNVKDLDLSNSDTIIFSATANAYAKSSNVWDASYTAYARITLTYVAF